VTIARNAVSTCDVQHSGPTHQTACLLARAFEPYPVSVMSPMLAQRAVSRNADARAAVVLPCGQYSGGMDATA
jgi:hypothetical protein